MKEARVRKYARLGRLELPRLAGGDLLRIEAAGLRGRGVRERVLVDPDDGVACLDGDCFRIELGSVDRHRVSRRG